MENKDNVNVQTEKKKVRKIGRLTFGITLILVGLSVVIQTFLPIEIFRYILMLWPLVFISIGIEVIYFSKREEIKDMLYKLTVKIPNVRANLMGAIKRANINGWKEIK